MRKMRKTRWWRRRRQMTCEPMGSEAHAVRQTELIRQEEDQDAEWKNRGGGGGEKLPQIRRSAEEPRQPLIGLNLAWLLSINVSVLGLFIQWITEQIKGWRPSLIQVVVPIPILVSSIGADTTIEYQSRYQRWVSGQIPGSSIVAIPVSGIGTDTSVEYSTYTRIKNTVISIKSSFDITIEYRYRYQYWVMVPIPVTSIVVIPVSSVSVNTSIQYNTATSILYWCQYLDEVLQYT